MKTPSWSLTSFLNTNEMLWKIENLHWNSMSKASCRSGYTYWSRSHSTADFLNFHINRLDVCLVLQMRALDESSRCVLDGLSNCLPASPATSWRCICADVYSFFSLLNLISARTSWRSLLKALLSARWSYSCCSGCSSGFSSDALF